MTQVLEAGSAREQLGEPRIILEKVSKSYHMGKIEVPALREVTLDIAAGEFIVFLGPSGSGKTTLLNLIGGLDSPSSGRIVVNGVEITRLSEGRLTSFRRTQIGFIFQFFNLIPTLTAKENVEFAAELVSHRRSPDEILRVVGLEERMKHGGEACATSLMGLEEGSTMYTLLTPDGSPTSVVPDGVLLTSFLSSKLAAVPGDTLHLEPIVGSVGDTEMRLAGLIDEPIGGRAYVPLKDAQELLRLPGAATGVLLRFEGPPSAGLLERIYKLPETASIELAGEVESFIAEFMDFFWVFIGVMLAISFALGMAIIFNGVTVNVLERRREIAIMRAVGMSNFRLSLILSLENLAIGCLGVAMGLPGGYYLTSYFMQQFESDIMSMPMVIYPRSYVIAGLSAAIILFVSQIPAIRQVCRMSLPTVTKDWAE